MGVSGFEELEFGGLAEWGSRGFEMVEMWVCISAWGDEDWGLRNCGMDVGESEALC